MIQFHRGVQRRGRRARNKGRTAHNRNRRVGVSRSEFEASKIICGVFELK